MSEIPLLFTRNILPIDVALIQVSPPDQHGFCSLGICYRLFWKMQWKFIKLSSGPSVDVSITAVQCAKKIIAQINPNMPRTFGMVLLMLLLFNNVFFFRSWCYS